MFVRLITCIILLLIPELSGSYDIQAQERTDRQRERRIDRIEDRAVHRLAARALLRAQLKAKEFERLTERQQQRLLDRQSDLAERDSQRAEELIQDIRISRYDLDRRKKVITTIRNEFGLNIIQRNGKDMIIRQGEIIALNLSSRGHEAVKELNLKNIRSFHLASIASTIDVFAPDDQSDLALIMQQLKQIDPQGQYEFNQVYKVATEQTEMVQPILKFVNTGSNISKSGQFTIGLIDTGVKADHYSLQNTKLYQENFGRGENVVARNHGTAISSIIARYGQADVYVADIFSGTAGFGDTEAIIRALDWLAESEISVINMSLTGPDNFLLRYTISSLANKGHIIVAAVGNEGPGGPERFPAAYNKVVGVTAVDAKNKIYKQANQGNYVDIAAPGVDILASAIKGVKIYSGTSFAAPFVSAQLASRYNKVAQKDAERMINTIIASLTDLGKTGYDPVFGFGLLDTEEYLFSDENYTAAGSN